MRDHGAVRRSDFRVSGCAAARTLAVALAGLAALVACGLGQPTADAAGTLHAAGPALAKVQTVAIDMKFGKGATYQGFTLVSASGKVKLPGDSDTVLKAQQTQDSLIELRMVTTGGDVFLQAPFIGFTQLSPTEAAKVPSVARIFDGQQGLPALLAQGRNPASAGQETVDGVDCDKITTTYPAALVAQAVQPLQPSGDVTATLLIGRSDHLLRKARLEGTLFGSTKSTVDVHLHDFNKPVDISRPI